MQYTTENVMKMMERIAQYDRNTFDHSLGVSYLSEIICKRMGQDEENIKHAKEAGMLHDIGKCFIRPDVLNKPASFSDKEKEIMELHPKVGMLYLSHCFEDIPQPILDAVLMHHIAADGNSGYPRDTLASVTEIGFITSVVAVSDKFDALIRKRPYKERLPECEVIRMMDAEAKNGTINMSVYSALKEIVQGGKICPV